jgi:uncharacterized Zn-binding protein involved in type VI secretion
MPPAVRAGTDLMQGQGIHIVPCPLCMHAIMGMVMSPMASQNVMIENKGAVRLGDQGILTLLPCCGAQQFFPIKGSGTVFINNKPAIRIGDPVQPCCAGTGQFIPGPQGASMVIIGG